MHFHEKLNEVEHIDINLKTVERMLMKENLISPFAAKKTKKKLKRFCNQLTKPPRRIMSKIL